MTAAPTTGAGKPLDRDAVMAALGPAADALRALDIVPVTGSTNEDLLAGPAGDADPHATHWGVFSDFYIRCQDVYTVLYSS